MTEIRKVNKKRVGAWSRNPFVNGNARSHLWGEEILFLKFYNYLFTRLLVPKRVLITHIL